MKAFSTANRLRVLLLAISACSVLVNGCQALIRDTPEEETVERSFCALGDSSILYTSRDQNEGVLIQYDRATKSRRTVMRAKYLITNLSASADDRLIAFRWKSPDTLSGGLSVLNTSTGKVKLLCSGTFDSFGAPVLSPNGSHLAYGHVGRGAQYPAFYCGAVSEVDVRTGIVSDIVPYQKYVPVAGITYIDENRILFSGQLRTYVVGPCKYEAGTFVRGTGVTLHKLPDGVSLDIFGYSTARHELYAAAAVTEQADVHVTVIAENNFLKPARWRSLPEFSWFHRCSVRNNELFYWRDEARGNVIYSVSLSDNKARELVAIPG